MNVDEFEKHLMTKEAFDIVQELLYDAPTFCFREKPELYFRLRKKICENFDIHQQNFAIVGSAKTGFSLDPKNYPRQFDEGSDIDVVLVSEEMFQFIWLNLLQIEKGQIWRHDLRNRQELKYLKKLIFQGWIRMDIIYKNFDFAKKWWEFFNKITLEELDGCRQLHVGIFKTWYHASLYYEQSIRQLREKYERSL